MQQIIIVTNCGKHRVKPFHHTHMDNESQIRVNGQKCVSQCQYLSLCGESLLDHGGLQSIVPLKWLKNAQAQLICASHEISQTSTLVISNY